VWTVVVLDAIALAVGSAVSHSSLTSLGVELLVWSAAVAVVGVAAIPTSSGRQLGLDMPVLLAAGFVLGPIPAGLIAVIGYVDMREFRRGFGVERALFNRAQTSLSVILAASTYSLLADGTGSAPLAALCAVVVDGFANFSMIASVVALAERVPARTSLARLRLGSVLEFAGTYGSFGLLSLLLAHVYEAAGLWALLLFATPLVLARQALSTTQKLHAAERRLRTQAAALSQASDQAVLERRDERLAIAATLHDDVMPPLFRIHLLGQVLRQELSNGQLLALEDDLPALIDATDDARETVRSHIRGLRSSSLGSEGLSGTLRLLVRQLELDTHVRFSTDLAEVTASPVIELLAYQVGREALRNAIRHASADSIRVVVEAEDGWLRLIVQDDGRGFSPRLIDESEHFGLALIRERVELAGGAFTIHTTEGEGTTVAVRLPQSPNS
jgi:signal transduction histidine kinase